MKIGIPKELNPSENRVALTPDNAGHLQRLGFELLIESAAGARANFSDDSYLQAEVTVVADAASLWREADIIMKVLAPLKDEIYHLNESKTLISFILPAQNDELLQALAATGATVLAMDSIPRLSRAQKMDALSSMANIAGYRAVIEAAQHFGRFFTGQVTAAGKVPPAKVMVIGAGVAGLAAIGTANSLGAIVRAFDTRLEVKEQIESMGAEFLELDFQEEGAGEGGYAKTMSKAFIEAEMTLFAEQAKEVDIIISTALIPGKPAPELITSEMVESMQQGSVIVDLAAEQGGNCKLTQAGRVVSQYGVTLVGYTDFPSRLATQSSQLYASNLRHLISDLTPEKNGQIHIDMEDDVIRGATVIKSGSITWPPPVPKLSASPKQPPKVEVAVVDTSSGWSQTTKTTLGLVLGGLLLLWIGAYAPASFLKHFSVFILACFIGYMVIWNVIPSLHTPLMSVTNAISSIVIIGALIQVSLGSNWLLSLAGLAILITSINIAGGFAVTQRMLKMFRK